MDCYWQVRQTVLIILLLLLILPACIESVHYASVSRMSSTTSNLPQNLAHAHLSHFWQGSSCL